METTNNPFSRLPWVQVREGQDKAWSYVSRAKLFLPLPSSVCRHSSEMVQNRTGYLGTNALWAQPRRDRQAGLPALMYALASLAVVHHPSAHTGFCAALRGTQSPLPLELQPQFSFWRAHFSRERQEGTCSMLKASAHSSSTPEWQQLAQLPWEAPQNYHLAQTTHAVDVSSSACLQGEGKVLQLLLETPDPCRELKLE